VTLALVAPTPALTQLEVLRARLSLPDLPLEDALDARDQAEVLRGYAQQARLGLDVSNEAIEIKLRAERRAGTLLHDMLTQGVRTLGGSPATRGAARRPKRSLPNGTLQRAGITAMQSSSWQLIAQIPAPEFEQRLTATKQAGRQLSTAAMVRAGRQFLRQPNQGGNGQTSPTLRRLRQCLLLMREIRALHSPAEVEVARTIVGRAQAWAVVLEARHSPTTAVPREVCCLLCGRARPANKPPKCPACGGHWYQ